MHIIDKHICRPCLIEIATQKIIVNKSCLGPKNVEKLVLTLITTMMLTQNVLLFKKYRPYFELIEIYIL